MAKDTHVAMPELKANPQFFRRSIASIMAVVPPFSLSEPIDFSAVEPPLREYFSVYGFDRIDVQHTYFFGFRGRGTSCRATHFWRVDSARATIFVAHGLFDHVGLYLDLVEFLLSEGYSVLAIDFPGHGLSGGARAVVEDFSAYSDAIYETLADFDALESKAHTPCYAIGQSTGAAALLHYTLVARGQGFQKLALLAPLIRPRAWRSVNWLYRLGRWWSRFITREFTVNSHRSGFNDFLRDSDPLQPRHISVAWVGAMKRWVDSFPELETRDVPVLVVQGDEDLTVDWQGNLPLIEEKLPRARIVMVPGARHHLVKEGDAWQRQVFSATKIFFDD